MQDAYRHHVQDEHVSYVQDKPALAQQGMAVLAIGSDSILVQLKGILIRVHTHTMSFSYMNKVTC